MTRDALTGEQRELLQLLARAHRALDDRDKARAAGRPWPTPYTRFALAGGARRRRKEVIVR